jgi:hypothetical protein
MPPQPSLDRDVALLRALLPHWHATRRWAEELLVRALGLRDAREVLKPEHRGLKYLPGSLWFYRTHGLGVNLDRGLACGGIDFDFDQFIPDPWRLRLFTEKQLNAGNLPALDYLPLFDDEDRFVRAAKLALAPAGPAARPH